jgi:hypothetical protein
MFPLANIHALVLAVAFSMMKFNTVQESIDIRCVSDLPLRTRSASYGITRIDHDSARHAASALAASACAPNDVLNSRSHHWRRTEIGTACCYITNLCSYSES